MSRYVNLDQIIADIFDKWGCDPAYYVGVSGADAHEAKLDADLIEFLRSKPYIEITRCGECEHYHKDQYFECAVHTASVKPDDFCGFGERRNPNE